ncbi:MAG TPA: hypothetical protein VNY73_05425 [Bacteroidia bacterium]|nr:hypothetical protein [Bacteroidia bacterium]
MKNLILLVIAVFTFPGMTSCKKSYTCTCTSSSTGAIFTKPTVTTVGSLSERSGKRDAAAWCAGLQKANSGIACSIQ